MKKFALYILVSVLIIILAIAAFVVGLMFVSGIMDAFLLPEDYLFYEGPPLYSNIIVVLFTVPLTAFVYSLISLTKRKIVGSKEEEDDEPAGIWLWNLMKKLGKWNILLAIVWVFLCYFFFTCITYVTPEKIVKVSPFNLSGEEYSYTDVEKIETGFGQKKWSFAEYEKKGNFYYKIYIDGEMTVFSVTTPNPDIERYEDTYLELEEFDSALTELDIPKEAGSKGYENCELDSCYVERFLRIIDRK